MRDCASLFHSILVFLHLQFHLLDKKNCDLFLFFFLIVKWTRCDHVSFRFRATFKTHVRVSVSWAVVARAHSQQHKRSFASVSVDRFLFLVLLFVSFIFKPIIEDVLLLFDLLWLCFAAVWSRNVNILMSPSILFIVSRWACHHYHRLAHAFFINWLTKQKRVCHKYAYRNRNKQKTTEN